MNFNSIDYQTHNSIEQLKRISSAQKISANKITVDAQNQTAVISGSGSSPYAVTLNSCECSDFKLRGLPCKHIYRLALELNLLPDLPTYNKKAAKQLDFQSEIERFRSQYENGSLSLDNFVKIADTLSKLKI